MSKLEHNWELKPDGASKYWMCSNCGAIVQPNSTQIKWNFLRKPNKKRKFDGMYCGELVVHVIHES